MKPQWFHTRELPLKTDSQGKTTQNRKWPITRMRHSYADVGAQTRSDVARTAFLLPAYLCPVYLPALSRH
jgi:hypothetical protein